ncbi:MAG: ABC transporter ATP-binding protein [Coprococcus sp.]
MEDDYFFTQKMCVGYNGKPLIRDIEIRLKKGNILTLIGPNGAGKSTILKSIAGQLALIGGTVWVGRDSLQGMKREELAKKMSVVFTEKIKAEMMTCEDIVATGRYPYTGKFGILSEKDYRIMDEAMDLVHITEIRDRPFDKISDGQKQRVMLARALAQEPEIIILDEPTSYLDVKYKLEFLSVLQEMRKKKGLTVIMSLHELELAERISDQIVCVKGQYINRIGTAHEIFRPDYIKELFDIRAGCFDEENTSMELEAVKGEAEVFIIAGGGTGKDVYRRMQREGTAFAAGILFENDLDYPVAKALAADVVQTEGFEPITEAVLDEAKRKLDSCKRIICCKSRFGSLEQANEELLAYARSAGKVIEMECNTRMED